MVSFSLKKDTFYCFKIFFFKKSLLYLGKYLPHKKIFRQKDFINPLWI